MELEKRCTKCREYKSLTEFYKDKTKKDGLRNGCKSCVSKSASKTYKKYKEDRNSRTKKYYKENKKAVLAKCNEYKNRKYKECASFRVHTNLSNQLRNKLNGKKKSTIEMLGCTPQYFHNIVMRGQDVEADHIYPVSWFDMSNPDHVTVAWHYSNFQPLSQEDNRSKGNDYAGTPCNVICYKEEFNADEYVRIMLPKINRLCFLEC